MKYIGSNEKGEFSKRVVRAALDVPRGRVTTYGRLAKAAGAGGMAAQSITTILGKAYEAGEIRIPFHRIVYADGTVWFDAKHEKTRRELYKKEGIMLDKSGRIQNFAEVLWEFK